MQDSRASDHQSFTNVQASLFCNGETGITLEELISVFGWLISLRMFSTHMCSCNAARPIGFFALALKKRPNVADYISITSRHNSLVQKKRSLNQGSFPRTHGCHSGSFGKGYCRLIVYYKLDRCQKSLN